MRIRIAGVLVVAGFGLSVLVASSQERTLTFEERVAAQRAIEQVYWNHRIWPENNPGEKPPLSAVLPEPALRGRVERALTNSALLESYWRRPLTGDDLQGEIDRMMRDSKSPQVLKEIFSALHDDPFLIAECLARPLVAERRVAALDAHDESLHCAQRRDLEASFESLDGAYEDWAREVVPRRPRPDLAIPPPPMGYTTDRSLLLDCNYDRWSPTTTVNAPSARMSHTAIWTGAEMIVWGGYANAIGSLLSTGGRYDPATDAWTATSVVSAPTQRFLHTALWTGSVMIVWGGESSSETDTGARYNPASDTWTATSTVGAPTPRQDHTSVWTGSRMIIWGGYKRQNSVNIATMTGGMYDPNADSWVPTSTGTNVPSQRSEHSAVWTGSRMIVWGGSDGLGGTRTNTGGRYDPGTDTWLSTSTGANVPRARVRHTAVWTGSVMVVFGGEGDFGGNAFGAFRYNPVSDAWLTIGSGGAPSETRTEHSAVWTGNDMIIWGGFAGNYSNNGGRYVPQTNTWPSTSLQSGAGLDVPMARGDHSAVYAGSLGRMIIWGGHYSVFPVSGDLNTGGLYCAGECVHATPCNDADLCTGPGVCASGTCATQPIPCVPIDSCHEAGVCNPASGICTSPMVDCNDSDACTSESCSPSLGCQYTCIGGGGCVPGPVPTVAFDTDKITLTWDHANGGTSSDHDVARGKAEAIPDWSVGATCVASRLAATSLVDGVLPVPGGAFWYDVRGHHACGAGPWGSQTDGTPRAITTCP